MQLLYSTRGTLLLEVDGGQWVLPPQRAALINAKVRHRVMARVPHHVLVHFGDDLTIETVARAAGVSPRTLARRFESEAKMGFRTFVRLVRVHRAIDLLMKPQARVTEVALDCGFQSLAAFTHAFVEVVRERPKDFRRRNSGLS